MKKFIFMCMFALCGLFAFAGTPDEPKSSSITTIVNQVTSTFMDKAIDMGYGTKAQKQEIQNSKVIEIVTNEFMTNGFDAAKAIDKGAEVVVNKGWFKDKTSAKNYLKKTIEVERKKESNWKILYNILGL